MGQGSQGGRSTLGVSLTHSEYPACFAVDSAGARLTEPSGD